MQKNNHPYAEKIDQRKIAFSFLKALINASPQEIYNLAQTHIDQAAIYDLSAPFQQLQGLEAIINQFYKPLQTAFSALQRRDLIFIGGENIREIGGYWTASLGHYMGNFHNVFMGIAPHHHLAFLRVGEFHHWHNGKIINAKIILDLADLLRQTGKNPFPKAFNSYGAELSFPAPATQDGIIPTTDNGDHSLNIINHMIADLHQYDPKNYGSAGQTGKNGYWHEDMLWYGISGIGSNYGWDGFVKDHRAPFLNAFPDRKGGNHYCRIGDGNYAAISGWPSMTMTHKGEYLGIKPSYKPLTLRVMDFYRCADQKIAENWVMLDYVDLCNQMGYKIL